MVNACMPMHNNIFRHSHYHARTLHLKALTATNIHVTIAAPTIALLPRLQSRNRCTLHHATLTKACQCTNIIYRRSHYHACTLHLKALTATDIHISHRSADNRAPPETAITLPTHPAHTQLSIHATHIMIMHSYHFQTLALSYTCTTLECTYGKHLPAEGCTFLHRHRTTKGGTIVIAVARTD
jgi:hypothetical protein